MTSPQPVFIFGYTHSGTSLLQGILRRHPSVFSQMSETSFYQFPHNYMHDYPSLDSNENVHGMITFCANLITKGHGRLLAFGSESLDPNLLSIDELNAIQATLSNSPTHREIFPKTFDFLAQRENKQIWVEKTPDHTQQAKRILNELPHAKAIEIVRDARDIFSSKKLREVRLRAKINSGEINARSRALLGYSDYDPFWNGLAWKSAISAVNAARSHFADRILTIRYEDLTASSESTVKQVCDFIDIEFTPEMLDADLENTADADKEARKAGTGIVSSSVGRYHDTLSRGDKALANRLLFAELRQHGYTVPTLSTSDRLLAILILLRSLPKLIVRIVNKFKHRGAAHTLDSLKNYVRRVLPS